MFCPKCGNEIAEGSAFCGKCGAPVGAPAGGTAQAGSAQGATGAAVGGTPAPKKNGTKIGVIAAVVVVVVVLVAGFATNWFGLAGVQPKEAVEVPAASQGADGQQDANTVDGQGADIGENAGDAQGDSQAAGAAVKSEVEAYTWDELSQISAEIGAAGDETAAIEVAKKYNLCTPEGKLDGTQVKSVTLADGAQTTVQIVGFAHDDKTSGGKAGITFIFGDCVGEAPMNPTETNVGGWEASQMRGYLNSNGMNLLPKDLRSVIVPVDKLTNNMGEAQDVSAVTTTSDSLWLFSLAELAGPIPADVWEGDYEYISAIFNAESSRYKLFSDMSVNWNDANPIIAKNYQNSSIAWWERSTNSTRVDDFLCVTSEGKPFYSVNADDSGGVVPGFCI
ncbi:hypothetical protein ADLECEL_11700 [Adlercreutzia equolifaciens subsp. celatus]|uniref:Uncharacterized protein n=1 Tax=Adlercreutzia equolifaciens subsp. celatus DSM 18785 TaxID=1121021 RepID=A0A3N0AML5_9ACTN|nr:DUF6273 domain-containing protein [Adlercreutzia equolifaciens]MCP2078214.1 zinc-ribbon domain-containing protein [Adlercreutzia equolifaciens subsp. celatus DSM 18785]RFT91038.1 zinc ribbon domain-containing protein [Adlercreutzia equolifaciens subsp. celatus]RNL35616.1 hypothetical protein DMP10_11940 [Adlercreutzia equolifaciens subsp. celatus DSM 18785]BCS57285.1 hypothetical protein ADLECEL_11700 [Adlercreutzia equolifaciens subsp. celatus]